MSVLDVGTVAACTRCPAEAVAANWPDLAAALAAHGPTSGLAEVGLAATIAVETAWTFRPIEERWPKGETAEAYFARYAPPNHVAIVLGNHSVADAVLYRGRGYSQLTGRNNYAKYGPRVGVDLVTTPERALAPDVSAAIAGCYWADHGLTAKANASEWEAVRRGWNGGLNGYAEFKDVVDRLLTYLPEPPAPVAPDAPPFNIFTRGLPREDQ